MPSLLGIVRGKQAFVLHPCLSSMRNILLTPNVQHCRQC